MLRRALSVLIVLAGAQLAPAATLEQLSIAQMIDKSTGIIQGKVLSAAPLVRNSLIYTCYQIQVTQSWKGSGASQQHVCVPGGVAQGLRQTFSGAPELVVGQQYVVFLWAGKSGMNQVIGLSQGLFAVGTDAQGNAIVSRPVATEQMLDAGGQPAADQPVSMLLSDLRNQIVSQLAGKGNR